MQHETSPGSEEKRFLDQPGPLWAISPKVKPKTIGISHVQSHDREYNHTAQVKPNWQWAQTLGDSFGNWPGFVARVDAQQWKRLQPPEVRKQGGF
jgi:hypothetical protein